MILRWVAFLLFSQLAISSPVPKQVVAYVFPGDKTLDPATIAANQLTRINYAFANIKNGRIVEGFAHDPENFAALRSLKARNPPLQILISVGGWGWSGQFSDMALTPESRRVFIRSALHFVRKYGLNGLDIDWEYPGLPGAGNRFRPEDKQNYTALVRELRASFGPHLLLSVAAGAQPDFLAHTNMGEVARFVDTVNLMSYDLYEPTDDRIAGHHAPLYTNPADPKLISADAAVLAFHAAGVPFQKFLLGIPFYGHAWSQVADRNNGLYQPGKGSKMDANYFSIVPMLAPSSGYVRHWDGISSVPSLYNPATQVFVSYEDPQSIKSKCRYVVQHHLGGVMFWDYEGDSNGTLLNAITAGLH